MPLETMNADHIAAENGGYEPQRANNGMLYFYGVTGGERELPLAVQTFPLPKETTNVLEAGHLNETRKYAGKTTFEDLTVVFRDYVDEPVARALAAWRRLVYNPATGLMGLAREYKRRGSAMLFGPNGQYDREYKLIGCWPSAFDPGDMDHESDEQVLINITITIDKAIPGEGVVGGSVEDASTFYNGGNSSTSSQRAAFA
jgi:hypothetical protein